MELFVFNNKNYSVILSCFLVCSCSGADNQSNSDVQPVIVHLSNKVEARVTVGYHDKKGEYHPVADSSLNKLFDKDNKTWWVSTDKGCGVTVFDLDFDRHQYIKKISVRHHGATLPLIGSISTRESSAENAPMISASKSNIALGQDRMQILPLDGGFYLQTLAAGEIVLSTEGCSAKNGKLEIEEIEFEFSATPPLKPEMTAAELKARLRSTAVWNAPFGWHFLDDENEPNKEKYLAHLMYYGINGDSESEKLFRGYSPSGADLSEDHSALESWYDEMRQDGKKLKEPSSN